MATGLLLILNSCQPAEKPSTAHPLLQSVLFMQSSAEYRGLSEQAYATAERMLEAALADKNWTAATEQSGNFQNLPPAVILDVDETVLDNSAYEAHLIKTNTSYNRESWAAWCAEARATAVPGALAFCQAANKNGVTVFYVTNRREAQKEDTRQNLKKLGFPLNSGIETIIPKTDSSDKGARRKAIARNFRICLLIGDNAGDFFSGYTHAPVAVRDSLARAHHDLWGTRWIVLPNPMYGDWESALFDYDYSKSAALRNSEKAAHLRY